jgi:hypothetical protein
VKAWADGFDPRFSLSTESIWIRGPTLRDTTACGGAPSGARAVTERQRYARRRSVGRQRPRMLASPPKPALGVNRTLPGRREAAVTE